MASPLFDPWTSAWALGDALAVQQGPALLWQQRRRARLQALLTEVLPRSPFYSRRLAPAAAADLSSGQPWTALSRLPPVDRAELCAHFDDWCTDGALNRTAVQIFRAQPARSDEALLGRYLLWESSGSSGGEPACFVQDAYALAVHDALEAARGPARFLSPAVWAQGGPRVALVAATGGRFAAVQAFERARQLNPWLQASTRAFDFLLPLPELRRRLEAFRPTVLAAYPSMARVLAEALPRGSLPLQAVWTGGETLTPACRQRVGRAFGVPVHDAYGASECFTLAHACREGRLHLNADWVLLEPVDAQDHPVSEGEWGAQVLLTSLINRVQPLLRYRLADSVRLLPAGTCTCGSPLPVLEVEGRSSELMVLQDGQGRSVSLAPLALVTVMEEQGGVFDFRLQRIGPRRLQLSLGSGADAARARRALADFLSAQGLSGVRVDLVSQAEPLARARSGKCPRFGIRR